jgi:hypothetical protein
MSDDLAPATEPEVTPEEVRERLLFENQNELYQLIGECIGRNAPTLTPAQVSTLGPLLRDVSKGAFLIGVRVTAEVMGANDAPRIQT